MGWVFAWKTRMIWVSWTNQDIWTLNFEINGSSCIYDLNVHLFSMLMWGFWCKVLLYRLHCMCSLYIVHSVGQYSCRYFLSSQYPVVISLSYQCLSILWFIVVHFASSHTSVCSHMFNWNYLPFVHNLHFDHCSWFSYLHHIDVCLTCVELIVFHVSAF